MKRAASDDIPILLELMAGFYAEAGFELNRAQSAAGFAALLADERLGGVWIGETNQEAAGYVVLTLCFGLEYAGPIGFVDDFFVRASCRGGGLGVRMLDEVREHCRAHGVHALFVEVGPDNAPALHVYHRFGFTDTGRQLLALPLAPPAHLRT